MINRVVLTGRLTRDPELRRTSSNMAVASFTIAVDDSYRSANGEKNTLFMNCSIFGVRAENIVKFTRKGSLVGVEGRLNQRKYVRKADNVQVTTIEVIADNVEFLDTRNSNPSGARSGYQSDAAAPAMDNQAEVASETSQGKNLDSIDVIDDDLPF